LIGGRAEVDPGKSISRPLKTANRSSSTTRTIPTIDLSGSCAAQGLWRVFDHFRIENLPIGRAPPARLAAQPIFCLVSAI
jgi:hypothetical protein